MGNRFIERRRKLLKNIEDNSLVVLFAGREIYKSADETYEFTPNRNFFYLSGIDAPNIIIALMKRKGEVAEEIFVERPDPVLARWVGEKLSAKEAREISGIEIVDIIDNFKGSIASLLSNYSISNVYLDLERQEYNIPKTFSQEFAGNILERYPYIRIKNIYDDI
ncbi:MAG TPA: Xaa-Pro aminopeptidase, partial [Clostridiaceae bacterium]|nr:Xaa-Pro aminopeptidase [Clostridiaceae bacterium]